MQFFSQIVHKCVWARLFGQPHYIISRNMKFLAKKREKLFMDYLEVWQSVVCEFCFFG